MNAVTDTTTTSAEQVTQTAAVTYLADKPGAMLMFLAMPFIKSNNEGEIFSAKSPQQPFAVRYHCGKGLWMVHTKNDMSDRKLFPTIEQTVEHITRNWW